MTRNAGQSPCRRLQRRRDVGVAAHRNRPARHQRQRSQRIIGVTGALHHAQRRVIASLECAVEVTGRGERRTHHDVKRPDRNVARRTQRVVQRPLDDVFAGRTQFLHDARPDLTPVVHHQPATARTVRHTVTGNRCPRLMQPERSEFVPGITAHHAHPDARCKREQHTGFVTQFQITRVLARRVRRGRRHDTSHRVRPMAQADDGARDVHRHQRLVRSSDTERRE